MKPPPFAYAAPDTLEEALALLAEHGDDASIIAGGQSLMPMLALRMARPAVLVDISHVADLRDWHQADDGVHVGATVRQRALLEDAELAGVLPLCARAARFIGHPGTRSRGTVVGSLCHADPAAELPVCARVLGAEFTISAAGGERQVAAADFFESALETTLREGEMVTELRIPPVPHRTGYAFLEIARRHGDFAIVAVGAAVTLGEDGALIAATVALGGVGDIPVAFTLDDLSPGNGAEDARITDFARAVAGAIEPGSDIHASADYRRSLAGTLTAQALRQAIGTAQGQD